MSVVLSSILGLLSVHSSMAAYNLIDTEPECIKNGLCEAITKENALDTIYPNPEERSVMAIINLARMDPQRFLMKYGNRKWTTGPELEFYKDDSGKCGSLQTTPYYWHSGANQAARWRQLGCNDCSTSCGAHKTCQDDCHFFDGDCGFGARANAFVFDSWAKAEGGCGQNLCYADGHCGSFFEPNRKYFGPGFAIGTNGNTNVYLNNGPDIDYPIPQATHFHENVKLNKAFYNEDGNKLVFMAQYYSDQGIPATDGYVVFGDEVLNLNLTHGSAVFGSWEVNTKVPDKCTPYYFIFVDNNGKKWRMPEEDNLFFGTAWAKWQWWEPENACLENHYYVTDSGDVLPNSGPNLTFPAADCVGCAQVNSMLKMENDQFRKESAVSSMMPIGSTTNGNENTAESLPLLQLSTALLMGFLSILA